MALQSRKICLIEDDPIIGEALTLRFELEGYSFDWFQEGIPAYEALQKKSYAIVVSDIRLPDKSGEAIFRDLLQAGINLPPFIFITGYGAIDQAVNLLKLGAEDYLVKPFEPDELLQKISSLAAFEKIGVDNTESLGISPAMQNIELLLRRLAENPTDVLITGESGVGKECVALKLHASTYKENPFVAVNCGALSESLLESELFGHEKGAFTGAIATKKGVFEQAENGTLFLDEIGDMPPSMQVKVLRAIQEKIIVRVGGEKSIAVNVQLISATHHNLKELVKKGGFREDLFYRINIIELKIPPLRERKDDILWFAKQFLDDFRECHQGNQRYVLSAAAEQALIDYPWPGNIRELKHCLERASILSNGTILSPESLFGEAQLEINSEQAVLKHSLGDYVADCERRYIVNALSTHNWEIQKTAEFLGCSRKTLWEKMRKHDINRNDGADK